jgi:hypothetical protein
MDGGCSMSYWNLTLILSHVTPSEYPTGLTIFLAGMACGAGLSIAAYRWFFRSR